MVFHLLKSDRTKKWNEWTMREHYNVESWMSWGLSHEFCHLLYYFAQRVVSFLHSKYLIWCHLKAIMSGIFPFITAPLRKPPIHLITKLVIDPIYNWNTVGVVVKRQCIIFNITIFLYQPCIHVQDCSTIMSCPTRTQERPSYHYLHGALHLNVHTCSCSSP